MEKNSLKRTFDKEIISSGKKLRHRPNERSDEKIENSVFLIEFPNASKAFWNVDVSHLAKFKWCVYVCECDLGWLWAKWLLTQNSYRFDMVRWWWHNSVLLFLGIFFFFPLIHFCALILTIVGHSTLPCLSVFSIFLYRAIELMPIWWSSISSDFSFSLNIKRLPHIPFHALIHVFEEPNTC